MIDEAILERVRPGDVWRIHQVGGDKLAVGDALEVAALLKNGHPETQDPSVIATTTYSTVARIQFMTGARNKYVVLGEAGELLAEIPAETVVQAVCFVGDEDDRHAA